MLPDDVLANNVPPVSPVPEVKGPNFFDDWKNKIKDFLSKQSGHPHFKYYAVGLILIAVAFSLFYKGVVLKEEISEFDLSPTIANAAGAAPNTSFLLKSSAPISATVIEKYLRFAPKLDYKIKKVSGEVSAFEITPNDPLATDRIYSLSIAEGPIAAKTYSWAYQIKAPFNITATLPRDKSNYVPTNTSIEITFNREDLINPQNSFEISPTIQGRFETHRNTLVFIPSQELSPKTIYTVKVNPSIKVQDSQDALAEAKEFQFETGERYANQQRPYFSFDKLFWEFKPGNEAAFEVNYSNLNTGNVPLAVYRFNDINEFISTYKSAINEGNGWTRYHSRNPITLAAEEVFESNIPLETQANVRFIRMPQKLDEGFYMADVLTNGKHEQAWFQVTPIASFSAISGTKTFIWLKDLNNGNSISEAEVSFDNGNMAKTDDNGVAMFNTPSQLIRDPKNSNYYSSDLSHFYSVKAGGKQVAIPVENEYGYFSKVSPPDAWWDYFSLDKNVYLPTDKVHFWGVVKQKNGTDIKGEEITVQLTNPFWDSSSEDITVYGETKLAISDFYTVTGEIAFSGLKPGLYQLNVKRGDEVIVSENVNVETYIKPAYKLTLDADKTAIFAGDSVTYKVKAEFFEGTPVSDLKLKYRGYLNGELSGDVQLDKNGEGSFTVKTDYREDAYRYWPGYLGMNVSPAVSEEGEINSSNSILAFGPHIDLRSSQKISEKTSKFELKLRNIEPTKVNKGDSWWNSESYLGGAVAGQKINVDVKELLYKQTETGRGYDIINKTTYPIYQYSTEERPVKQDTITTDGGGNAYYEWTPEEKKTYKITFSTYDSYERTVKREHYAYGGSFSYFGFYNGKSADLKNLDSDNQYVLGEQVNLQMQNSSGNALTPGLNNFAFLRINNGINSFQITSSPNYTDSFKDSYIPNVNIMGVWFNDSRFTNSYPLNLSFDSEERRLKVEITKDKDQYKPKDKVNLNIKVTDKNGVPKQAEVNISGIDEAVFSLNPEEKDITNNLYQDVFSYVVTRSSHLTPLESGAEKGCFVSGTEVWTPKGNSNIEDMRIGDEIFARNDNTGEIVKTKIKKISSHLVSGYLTINNSLSLTKNHQLFVNGTWKHAGEIKIGDILLKKDGGEEKVASLKFIAEWGLVYNIELEDYHTFFADGIYVHNEEKGGGGARADFRDLAIFKSVKTNSNGSAQVSFDVPDNLTSWRITSQAITKDLYAGKSVDFVPVKIPFFVDTAINRTYLAGDKLLLRLRTFGTANVSDNIAYTVQDKNLPDNKIEKTGSKEIEIPVGNLTEGKHQLEISAQSSGFSDSIIRDLNVVSSYFTKNSAEFYELSPGLSNIKGGSKGFTTLLFTSYERGRLYPLLRHLTYSYGVRADQKLSRLIAEKYLNKFFEEENEISEIDPKAYQYYDGMTLLPYSDKDLALSAKFANLIEGEETPINTTTLKQYFYNSFSDKKADLSQVILSLYGLSTFKEPVLIDLQKIKTDRNLNLTDKVYIALAFDNLGAKEEARAYYKNEIKPSLTTKKPFVYLNKLKNKDDNILATTLLAALTASLSEPEADGLAQYAIQNRPKETLNNFEMLLYLKNALPKLKGGDVSFSYKSSTKSGSKTLKNNEVFHLELSPEQLSTISFSDVNGRIGLVSNFEEESTPANIQKDSSIGISRSYSVDGQPRTEFSDGDLVRIDITPSFGSSALPGAYQIVDYLPSGLRAVTDLQHTPIDYRSGYNYRAYPSDIEDQKVTFVVWREYSRPFFYYARVVSKGNYKAEPALIQSLRSLDMSNISGEAAITIN